MPLERYFERPKEPTRITKAALIEEMRKEPVKHQNAVELAVTDFVDAFCAANPNFAGKEEFLKLFQKAEPHTPEEEIRIKELLKQMGSTPEKLRYEIMKTYANMNYYTIAPEG